MNQQIHDEIIAFIKSFKYVFEEEIEHSFSYGNCYYFCIILCDRFRYINPEIYFNPIHVHFATCIGNRLYDIKGGFPFTDGWISWNEFVQIHPTESIKIMNQCVYLKRIPKI